MERRKFISRAGILSAVLMFPFGKLFGKNLSADDEIKTWIELIEYARWCPSPHNVQPWKMKIISKAEAHLYYDPLRIPIIVDGTSAFSTAGMGMFIECLNIAARPSGFKIIAEHEQEQHLDCSSKEIKFFAKLYLIESNELPDVDRDLILKRKTSRLHYDGRILHSGIINALSKIAATYGHNFIYSNDKELINYAIDLNNESVLIRSQEAAVREEMCKWIRTTDVEAAEKKDGWWYRCTGISGKLLYNFFAHHERFESKWKRRSAKNILNKSMKGTSNLAWISGRFESRADWVNAGVMLQQLWLEMTKYNVYMNPFGPVITTPASNEKFRRKINYDESNGTLWFLIRLGYSNDPPRSFRLETKDILI
jgi:hypothetical protein